VGVLVQPYSSQTREIRLFPFGVKAPDGPKRPQVVPGFVPGNSACLTRPS